MNIGSLVISLGVDTTGLDNATKAMNSTSQKFRTFGYLASAALTLPIVMASKASFNMAKDYEYSIQKIVGLTGVAQSAVDQWSADILKMGPQLAQGPQELADALYFISSSGIKGAEAMQVLEVSAKAATAGLGQTKDVADLVTSVLNAYAGTGITAAKTTDILTAAVREGKAEAPGFASAMGQIVPIASMLGVSFDQVAGGMAAITLSGSSASNAAVYLKGVFNSLLKATAGGTSALKGMGSSYTELRDILRNQGLIALMQKLRDLQMQYGDEAISDVLPNIRALTGYMSIAGKNFQYNSELMERVTNSAGSLGKAFAAVSDTIKVRYDQAISQAKVSTILLGKEVAEAIIPILEKLVLKLQDLTKWFTALTEEQKKHILVITAIIAALGPLSLLIAVLGYAFSGMVSILSVLGGVWNILNAELIITSVGGKLISASIGTMSINFTTLGASIASASANIALFTMAALGIGAVIAIAVYPVFDFLITKIKEFKKQIKESQDTIKELQNFNNPGMQLEAKISRNMSVISKLDQSQLQETKSMIGQRIALERERLVIAETTGQKEIEAEQFVLDRKKEITVQTQLWAYRKAQYDRGVVTEGDYKTWGSNISMAIQVAQKAIDTYIANRKQEIEYDKISAATVIKFYEDRNKIIDKYIQKSGVSVATAKAAMTAIADLQKINGFGDDFKFKVPEVESTTAYKAFGIMGADQKGQSLYKGGASMYMPPSTDPNDLYKGSGSIQSNWEAQKTAIDSYNNSLQYQGKILDGLTNSFQDFFQNTGKGFKGMMDALVKTLESYLAKLAALALVSVILNAILPGSTMAVGALTNLRKFIGVAGYANGTSNAPGGWSMIGERGPELMNVPRGAQIFPNNMIGAALAGNGGGEVHFHIKDNELVGILRKAGIKNSLY